MMFEPNNNNTTANTVSTPPLKKSPKLRICMFVKPATMCNAEIGCPVNDKLAGTTTSSAWLKEASKARNCKHLGWEIKGVR